MSRATPVGPVDAVAQAGLPIGWVTVSACAGVHPACNWWQERGILSPKGNSAWQIVLVIIGFLVTIVALTPGARFWFDLLGKLALPLDRPETRLVLEADPTTPGGRRSALQRQPPRPVRPAGPTPTTGGGR